MSVSQQIVATYKGPGRVVRRLLSGPESEGRALAILMAACVITFIGQLPRLSREAHLSGEELNPLLGGALLGWVFMAPLIFYALAFVSHLLSRLAGGRGTGYGGADRPFLGASGGEPAHPAMGVDGGVRRAGCRAHASGSYVVHCVFVVLDRGVARR